MKKRTKKKKGHVSKQCNQTLLRIAACIQDPTLPRPCVEILMG